MPVRTVNRPSSRSNVRRTSSAADSLDQREVHHADLLDTRKVDARVSRDVATASHQRRTCRWNGRMQLVYSDRFAVRGPVWKADLPRQVRCGFRRLCIARPEQRGRHPAAPQHPEARERCGGKPEQQQNQPPTQAHVSSRAGSYEQRPKWLQARMTCTGSGWSSPETPSPGGFGWRDRRRVKSPKHWLATERPCRARPRPGVMAPSLLLVQCPDQLRCAPSWPPCPGAFDGRASR